MGNGGRWARPTWIRLAASATWRPILQARIFATRAKSSANLRGGATEPPAGHWPTIGGNPGCSEHHRRNCADWHDRERIAEFEARVCPGISSVASGWAGCGACPCCTPTLRRGTCAPQRVLPFQPPPRFSRVAGDTSGDGKAFATPVRPPSRQTRGAAALCLRAASAGAWGPAPGGEDRLAAGPGAGDSARAGRDFAGRFCRHGSFRPPAELETYCS